MTAKNNHADNAIADTENESSKRGPRTRYFACIHWKKKVYEMIEASSEDEATAKFAETHGEDPVIVDNGSKLTGGGFGFYPAKGTGISEAQRYSVTVTAEQMSSFTGTKFKAEYRGWNVFGNGLQAITDDDGNKMYDDDELVMIFIGDKIDKASDVKKPKLKKQEAVRRSDLENVTIR